MTTTAKLSNKSPAELVGIEDREIAFAFDRECAEILNEAEAEKEVRMLEMITAGQVTSMLGGKRDVREITPANFRDQNF